MSTEQERANEHDAPELPAMPKPVQNNPILRKCIWRRFEKNKNYVAGFVGETGSGKSWGALRLAEAVDPDFSIDQVAFSIQEFLELVRDDSYGSGSMIVFDEAAVEASHQKWYDESNYLLQVVLQTWRRQNRGAIFTMPELNKLNKNARNRLHAYIEMVDIDQHEQVSRAKYQRIDTNPKTGKNYFKYPRLRWNQQGVQKWKFIKLTPPSDDLLEAYEQKKREFTADLQDKGVEELSESEEDKEKTPREIADDIFERGPSAFIADNFGQQYFDTDLIEIEYDVGPSKAKKAKKLVQKEGDFDDVQ